MSATSHTPWHSWPRSRCPHTQLNQALPKASSPGAGPCHSAPGGSPHLFPRQERTGTRTQAQGRPSLPFPSIPGVDRQEHPAMTLPGCGAVGALRVYCTSMWTRSCILHTCPSWEDGQRGQAKHSLPKRELAATRQPPKAKGQISKSL